MNSDTRPCEVCGRVLRFDEYIEHLFEFHHPVHDRNRLIDAIRIPRSFYPPHHAPLPHFVRMFPVFDIELDEGSRTADRGNVGGRNDDNNNGRRRTSDGSSSTIVEMGELAVGLGMNTMSFVLSNDTGLPTSLIEAIVEALRNDAIVHQGGRVIGEDGRDDDHAAVMRIVLRALEDIDDESQLSQGAVAMGVSDVDQVSTVIDPSSSDSGPVLEEMRSSDPDAICPICYRPLPINGPDRPGPVSCSDSGSGDSGVASSEIQDSAPVSTTDTPESNDPDKYCMRRTLCNHTFCKTCIEKWLRRSKKCPMCMVDLEQQAAVRPQEF